MKKQVNYDVFTECIIAILSGFILIIKVVNGSYLDYVSPKFKILLIIAGSLLVVIGISRIHSVWKNSYTSHYKRYLLLAIPMLMLIIPHNSIAASSLKNSYSSTQVKVNKKDKKSSDVVNSDSDRKQKQSGNMNNSTANTSQNDNTQADNSNTDSIDSAKQNNTDSSSLGNKSQASDGNTQLSGLDTQAKKITVSDKEFYQWISELYNNYDKYAGYEVSIKGMKYQDDSISGDKFAIVRLAMVCCAVDMVPCGPICQYDKTGSLKNDTWYTVNGVLESETVGGQMQIKLNVKKVEEATAPDEPYVYPY